MQYFQDLPIRKKLLLPTFIVLFGFLAVGIIYTQSLNSIAQSQLRQHALDDFSSQMLRLEIKTANTLIHEKDFLLRHDNRYLQPHDQSLTAMLQIIQSMQTEAKELQLPLDISPLHALVIQYQEGFIKLRDNTLAIGINEESGLRGELRHTIHAIEKSIHQTQQIELLNSMLEMRRHEKDFLAREKIQQREKMIQEYQRFVGLLEKSNLPEKSKSTMLQQMQAYQSSFAQLVDATFSHQDQLTLLRTDSAAISPLLHDFDSKVHTTIAAEELHLSDIKQQQNTLFFTTLTLIAIMIAILLWFISKSIIHPLDQLLERIHELAKGGDLNQRLKVSGQHELAILSGYVNELMDNLATMLMQVQNSSQKVATSSNQLAASSREQEATVTEQAVTTQQMAASSREIATTAHTLQDSMESVTKLARQTNQSADQGQENLLHLEHALRHMIEASQSIGEKFGMLSEKAGSISKVVTTITKVADQTNLLSLNAAIEAEKAGEYGRGFSVVASEIRRLADQSAATTVEIESIVKDMQSAVAEGVMGMDKFSDEIRSGVQTGEEVSSQLQHIITQVMELTPCVESANEGLRNQAIGAQEISTAIEQLQVTTQQTQNMVIQTNQVIDELNNASQLLSDSLSQFDIHEK